MNEFDPLEQERLENWKALQIALALLEDGVVEASGSEAGKKSA